MFKHCQKRSDSLIDPYRGSYAHHLSTCHASVGGEVVHGGLHERYVGII